MSQPRAITATPGAVPRRRAVATGVRRARASAAPCSIIAACMLALAAPPQAGAQPATALSRGGGASDAARPHPVALVTGIEGSARLSRGNRARDLGALDTLDAGDFLRLLPGARVEVAFTAGAQRVFALQGPGRYALRGDAVVPLDAHSSLQSRDLVGDWRGLQLQPDMVGRASVSLRGWPDTPLQLRAPVGGQRSAAVDTLRWAPPFGAPGAGWTYAVRIIDARGELVLEASTMQSSLALPHATTWQRERSYAWTVTATGADGRRREAAAEFHVVSQETEDWVAAATQAAALARARLSAAAVASEDVLLALALDQAGLRNDADAQWRRVASARPSLAAWSELAP
jgi:hypothetical protein